MSFESPTRHLEASPRTSPTEAIKEVTQEVERLLGVLPEAVEAYPVVYVRGEPVEVSFDKNPDLKRIATVQRLKEGIEGLLSAKQEAANDNYGERALGPILEVLKGSEQKYMARADAISLDKHMPGGQGVVRLMDKIEEVIGANDTYPDVDRQRAA